MKPQQSRRSFITNASSSAAFVPLLIGSINELESAQSPTAVNGEAYWELVRRQFSFRDIAVPMNAANLCPSPRVVAERVARLTHDIDVDCSFNNRDKFKGLLETSRKKVAQQMGVSTEEIALVRNTSEANNIINNGLKLNSGDEVVLWDQNHPTNNVAWDVRAARFGLNVKRVATPSRPQDEEGLVQPFEKALGPKTRVLALTHVSNTSGVQLPVRQLCEMAHRHGIYVHVDGAQTWGAFDVDLRELGCDSYTASGHKWFVGPKEVGLLYVRQDHIQDIWPNVVASGWGANVEPDVRGARKFESTGQRDDAALAAIGDTVDFHWMIGQRRIEERVHELASYLKAELQDAGFKLVTPVDPKLSGGVCIIEVPADRRTDVFNRMYEEHGIAGAPTGGLRLCPHLYNTREHIKRAANGVKALRNLIG